MKNTLHLKNMLLLMLFFVSCQRNDDLFVNETESVLQMTPSVSALDENCVDEPIAYLADTDPKVWTHIGSLEERIAACNPSQELLDKMSTDALVQSFVHHPLNHVLFAYDEPLDFVEILSDQSAIHKELESREDAAVLIVKLFEQSEIEMNPNSVDRTRCDILSYDDEMFLEYYIASGKLRYNESPTCMDILRRVIPAKIAERRNQPERYSFVSIRPLYLIASRLDLNVSDDLLFTTNSTGNIYTPLGQAIIADYYIEATTSEIENWETSAATQYPDADIVGPATNLYNCHSYAWHSQSTSNTVWINDTNNQLSKYWTSDLYISTDQSHAEKIYYSGGDHSAIFITNSKYRSKWGRGPLMEHSPHYCPYYSTNLRYFKERSRTMEITGNDSATPGQTVMYYRGTYNDLSPTYTWSIDSYVSSSESTLPTLSTGLNADYVQVTFNSEGYYIIRLDVYVRNILFATGEKQVYVY